MPIATFLFPFIKAEATGNDFILVDVREPDRRQLWQNEFGTVSRAETVRRLAHRHFGLGADGVVFLERAEDHDFRWDFFNSDGGEAEMCGNAARAVALYAAQLTAQKTLTFATRVGAVTAQIHSALDIEVELPPIREEKWGEAFDFVNSGVPHVVIRAGDIKDLGQMRESALTVKRLPEFQHDGTNVTFLHLEKEGQIQSVTFERGVEDFTLACGTGAIAAAHSIRRGQENAPVQVRVPGGTLTVVFKNGRPFLRGPARIVAEMRLVKEIS